MSKTLTCSNCGWSSTTQSSTYTYDKLNRVVSQTDPAVADRVTGATHTKRTTTVYDADGHITSQTMADLTGGDASRTVSATYNTHGQQITSTDPANNTTTFGYDAYGNKNKVIDASNTETDYAFDANGHLTTTTLKAWTGDPVNPSSPGDLVVESRAYDPAGRLGSITDAMGWVTSYTYTDDGLTAAVTRSDPAHPGTSFVQESDSYDAAGNPIVRFTNNGATKTTMAVDSNNRVTSTVLDPSGVNRATTYVYNPDDAVLSTRTSAASGSSTVDATYDLMGRMTSKSVDLPTGTGGPAGWWRLNETAGTAGSDASGNQHPVALSAGASWSGGSSSALQLDGSTGAAATAGPVLDTTQSFTVSAWVNAAAFTSGKDMTVAEQDATHQSGFYLGYDSSAPGHWTFARARQDTSNAAWVLADSPDTPSANTWYHLVGVFDATNGGLSVYVNGTVKGTATDSTPIGSTGPLVIGRSDGDGCPCEYFDGQVSNVQVYPRALSAGEVSTLYTNGRTGVALASNRLTTTWTLDKRGLPTASTDPNGNTTTYTYDEANQHVRCGDRGRGRRRQCQHHDVRCGRAAGVRHVAVVHATGRHGDRPGVAQDIHRSRSGRDHDGPAEPPDLVRVRPDGPSREGDRAEHRHHPLHLRPAR